MREPDDQYEQAIRKEGYASALRVIGEWLQQKSPNIVDADGNFLIRIHYMDILQLKDGRFPYG